MRHITRMIITSMTFQWKSTWLLFHQLPRITKNHPGLLTDGRTLLPTKRDGHRNVGGQFHLILALLGVLSWSRLVAPLRPSNIFYLIVRGRLHKFHVVPPMKIDWKKLEGRRGSTLINQHRTPISTRKRWNWSPTFRCPSLFVRSSVIVFDGWASVFQTTITISLCKYICWLLVRLAPHTSILNQNYPWIVFISYSWGWF